MPKLKYFNNQKYIIELSKKNTIGLDDSYYNIYGSSLIYSTWLPPIPSKPFSRLLKSRILSLFGITKPEQLTISIIEDCPNHCIHCALPNTNNHFKLEINTIKKIITEALDIGFTSIILDGGEPLLYNQLEEIISFVTSSKAIVSLFSSGYSLDINKANQLKNAGLYSLSISIDSSIEEVHDKMRGRKGSFREAINGIKSSINAGLLVNMYCVLTTVNINELEKIYLLASSLNVHELSFYEIVPTGRWFDHDCDVLCTNDRTKYYSFIKNYKNKSGPRIFSGPSIIKYFGCMAGNKWIHITPEGFVQPCACIPLNYGNINNNRLKTIIDKIIKTKIYKNNYECLMRTNNFKEKLKK